MKKILIKKFASGLVFVGGCSFLGVSAVTLDPHYGSAGALLAAIGGVFLFFCKDED